MKKILSTLFMFFCVPYVFSQSIYTKDGYSASGMNVKGKVKKITEKVISTDENGEEDFAESKTINEYFFNESGKLIRKTEETKSGGFSIEDYNYLNGKISSITGAYADDGENFYYSTSNITIKTRKGEVKEVLSLSSGRVSETVFYLNDRKSHKFKFEYNTIGQTTKRKYYAYSEDSRFSTRTYEYNKQGDKKKEESYNFESKLETTTEYKFIYDDNKNWIKCTEEFYLSGQHKEDRVYQQTTRIYEFY